MVSVFILRNTGKLAQHNVLLPKNVITATYRVSSKHEYCNKGKRYSPNPSLTLALHESGHHALATFPRERTVTHCTGSRVGLRAGQDVRVNSHPPLGFKTQIIQPLASCYTKYDIPAAKYSNNLQNIMAPFDTVISNFTYMIFSPCTI